jgi:hypothetical protein
MIGVPAVIILVFFGYLIFRRYLQPIEGVEELGPQERGHDQSVVFEGSSLPPTGGVHHPTWLNCGVYRDPVEEELAVHSLEHGAVWLAYHPELPADQVALLEDYADSFTLVSPYPGLASPIVATAWGARLQVESAPNDDLESFLTRYRGQGPEAGATCSGGTGQPLS